MIYRIRKRRHFGKLLVLGAFCLLLLLRSLFPWIQHGTYFHNQQNNNWIPRKQIFFYQNSSGISKPIHMITVELLPDHKLMISFNGETLYSETYANIVSSTLRIVVISGVTQRLAGSRYFYAHDENLFDQVFKYVSDVFDGSIIVFITEKIKQDFDLKFIELLPKLLNCDLNHKISLSSNVLLYVKDKTPHDCLQLPLTIGDHFNFYFSKLNTEKPDLECLKHTSDNDLEIQRRIDFCSQFFAYKDYCKCDNPLPITFQDRPLNTDADGVLAVTPILIIASNRPYYTIKCIETLLHARGIKVSQIIVDVDEENPELMGLVKLFNLKSTKHLATCSGECRINNHYRSALHSAFSANSKAQDVFVFEDDLIVSSDILYYFTSVLSIYHGDNTIFCVSAWNDQAYSHSVGDLTMLYRVQYMPGLGFAISRTIFNELYARWPHSRKMNWDAWIRESVIDQRACIIPDVARTFHIGTFGVHSSPDFQSKYFSTRKFIPEIDVTLNLQNLTYVQYHHYMDYLAEHSSTISDSNRACQLIHLNKMTTLISHPLSLEELVPRTIKVFVNTHGSISKSEVFKKLFRCLHVWDLDIRNMHEAYTRIWFDTNHYIFIACPQSTFCKYMPKGHKMFTG